MAGFNDQQRTWLTSLLKGDPAAAQPKVPSNQAPPRAQMTSPLGNIAPYNKQGVGILTPEYPDPNTPSTINEHVFPTGVAKRITTGPDGTSPVTAEVAKNTTTLRTQRATAEAGKNAGDQAATDAFDAAKSAGRPLTPAEAQAMTAQAAIDRELAAARTAQDASVTPENTIETVVGELGDLSHAGRAQAQSTFKDVPQSEVDALFQGDFESNLSVAPEFMQPQGMGLPLPPDPVAPPAAPPPPAEPPAVEPPVVEPPVVEPPVVEPPVTPTAATTAGADAGADGAGAAAGGALGGAAGAGLLGGVMAAGLTMKDDYGKVQSGQMSVGEAAADVGEKGVLAGGLTAGGAALAKSLAATGARGGGVIGAVVGAGMALADDVGKVQDGQMTGGAATADVATKAAVGAAAGAAGAWAGAEIGLAAGSVVPGIGNVVGFVGGAIVGGVVGYVGSELTQTDTGKAVTAAVGGAVDSAIDTVKDAGSAISHFFGGGDPPEAAPPPAEPAADPATPVA